MTCLSEFVSMTKIWIKLLYCISAEFYVVCVSGDYVVQVRYAATVRV